MLWSCSTVLTVFPDSFLHVPRTFDKRQPKPNRNWAQIGKQTNNETTKQTNERIAKRMPKEEERGRKRERKKTEQSKQ